MFSFLGWVGLIGCVIGVFITLAALMEGRGTVPGQIILLAILPWLGGVVGSLVAVASGQLIQAAADTADNTGQMLAIMRMRGR
ncbi:MAG: hypothetical protein HC808_11540 [Candidatus Competibacteraceae bacterium]|nr:hypothetical protein [Candidatus Competibacteraceae bacterium]